MVIEQRLAAILTAAGRFCGGRSHPQARSWSPLWGFNRPPYTHPTRRYARRHKHNHKGGNNDA
jgi:hypothetical protein